MQPKTERNPKGSGRRPSPPDSKVLQIKSVPNAIRLEIRAMVKKRIAEYLANESNL